jgi:prevent-host-death family protein
MTSIGIRELRQQASYYLKLVAAGERVEVTDRGRPVAMLVPPEVDAWESLVVSGQVVQATGEGSVLDEAPVDYGLDASGRLAAMRADER